MAIDLNTASFDELQEIRMITSDRAHDIIAYREQHGPFRNWEEVKNVPGISKEMAQEIQREGGTIEKQDAA